MLSEWSLAGAIQIVMNGAFAGIGSAIGSYFALNYGIHKLEKLLKGGKNGFNNSKNR